jgi:biotin synthase-related radical SAM superfamily protein
LNLPVGVYKKALLLETGKIHLPNSVTPPFTEKPSAGPDAGLRGIFLRFGHHRVRMTVADDPGETQFKLGKNRNSYYVLRGESTFLSNISVEKPLLHAPNQAFINLASPCIFNCKYCATPELKIRFVIEPQRLLALMRSTLKRGKEIKAVSLTSGMIGTENKTIKLMMSAIKLIRKELDHQIPIGVEPYVTKKNNIDQLYSSGANEIKVNIESFDREIAKAVCPEKNHNKIASALEYSSTVFGKNRVCSNSIIGLGECDSTVLTGLEWMAERGIVTNLRPLLINPYRRKDLIAATQNKAERPRAERMLKLALSHKSILEKHRLKTFLFKTMCHKCTGCEITPQQDV